VCRSGVNEWWFSIKVGHQQVISSIAAGLFPIECMHRVMVKEPQRCIHSRSCIHSRETPWGRVRRPDSTVLASTSIRQIITVRVELN
jgi:hypothetical protein